GVSLVLSFRPEKKEPRREGSKKTWRSASDGSPQIQQRPLPPLIGKRHKKRDNQRRLSPIPKSAGPQPQKTTYRKTSCCPLEKHRFLTKLLTTNAPNAVDATSISMTTI
ncbi:hypothetical protein EDC59_1131, partial [Pseudodesulfovibrio indicus]